MSKIKYLIIGVFLLLPNIVSAGGYTIDKTSDFYSDIYDKQDELKAKYQKVTLLSGDTKENLSKLLNEYVGYSKYNGKNLPSCFTGEMTLDDFNTIIGQENVEILNKYLIKECIIKGTEVLDYINLMKTYNNQKTTQANNTIKQLNSIGKIGLYSDGDTSNSPFDIVQDMKEIDKIIFEREEYLPYNGVNIDYEKGLELLASGTKASDIAQKLKNTPTEEEALNNAVSQVQSATIDTSGVSNLNNQLCVDNSQSGLNSGIIDEILNPSTQTSTGSENTSTSGNNSSGDNSGTGTTGDGYQKTTDKSIWPCNEYFCITFEAQKATQELFGGFTMKFPAIDTLFKLSNKHLEKAANTSLAQSKMTTNNFELSLKNIDLGSMFNAGIFVGVKPTPILEVNGSQIETNGDFSAINMLEESYKALGLDYKYQNSLDILDDVQTDKYITETSKELTTRALSEKKALYDYQKEKNAIKLIALDKSVDNEMQKQDMKVLNTDLTEVEGYVKYFMEYAYQLYAIVKEMDKIPSN